MGLSKAKTCEGKIDASEVLEFYAREESLLQYYAWMSNESLGKGEILSMTCAFYCSAHKQLKVRKMAIGLYPRVVGFQIRIWGS